MRKTELLKQEEDLKIQLAKLEESLLEVFIRVSYIPGFPRLLESPGKSWICFLKIPGPGKSWKLKLKVLESPGKISLKVVHLSQVLGLYGQVLVNDAE